MRWIEKRPKSLDANIKSEGGLWAIRVKLAFPDGTVFERKGKAATKTAARRLRDDFYDLFNDSALSILAGETRAESPSMTLGELATRCRDSWWPARGRNADTCEQYYQKLRDYVFPVVGEDTQISAITPAHWEAVLAQGKTVTTERKTAVSTGTLKKVKAVLSSALSCAVANQVLPVNAIKGLAFDPNPLDEADRLGRSAEEMDEDAPAKRMLTDAEVALILGKTAGTVVHPLVVLQVCFGLRIGEALAVRWGDFDWANEELRVRYQVKRRRNPRWSEGSELPKSILDRVATLKSKSGRREIHIFPDARELLKTLPRGKDGDNVVPSEAGGLVEPRNAQRAIRDILDGLITAEKLASPRPTTHSFRSWRISHWANVRNLPPSQLMRIAGHSKIETTMKFYVRSHGDSLKQWLASQPAEHPSPLRA
ncbi:MAG: tyrosine-type recombinase/integrase [Fimbriimonas sp.]